MVNDKVTRLVLSATSPCQAQAKTWEELSQELKSVQVQVIFTSAQSFLHAAPKVQEDIKNQLKIPQFFFDRAFLQSNSFSGDDIWLDENEEVTSYTYWSRFTVKQTYDELKPKRTFTPHVSNHHFSSRDWNADIAVHGPQSRRYGWEWYEMGFFTCWDQPGLITLLCFDFPAKSQSDLQSLLCAQPINRFYPHDVFSLLSDQNHISQWEARRSQETDYLLLHEVARHGIHVSETLSVAVRSLDGLRQQNKRLYSNANIIHNKNKHKGWDKVGNRFEFQLQFLEGLLQRSEANNARIRNEITLFTIGWISSLPLEKEAARLVLDEEYAQEDVLYQNAYYLGGRIGEYEVVIGVQRKMGLSQAAILAEKMRAGFPNIEYFLVVGIAGGVPRYGPAGAVSEIVLGDVVVSYPRGNHGVLQYDKGAWQGQSRLNFRGYTNGVPGDLMAAVNNFRAEGWSKTGIAETLKQMRLKLDEKRQGQYDDPGPTRDRLFEGSYEHQGTELDDCKDCCDADRTISRTDRGDGDTRFLDEPCIHFGSVASSNQLQISAAERNRIQQEHEAICFGMEAAGVMEEYPCVVIRGICDYADSHKNKGWQDYAAATAAAYAKRLLSMVPAVNTTSRAESPKQTSYAPNVRFGDNNKGFQIGTHQGNISGLHFGGN
ncbi:purine and uridine phosphorylase [Corynespora cassiicola Philippines]|uniref:Purine and uridine phosphorylase n=1 Tax=Corynespora cassiicola Philippines TaxID=1448308 RepID=A0A2T2MZT6_CORCC|nr:purine and uridine phosphorylase [Corynespora cassiicola Philippines]